MPFHRAEKKVSCIDPDTAEPIEPEAPNAVKLETFVFDALPLCEASIIYETDRVEEFAPIKNADATGGSAGAVDCPATSKQLQTERAARWLSKHGVTIPRNAEGEVDARIEISHLTAIEPDDLAAVALPEAIKPGESRVL